VDQMINDVVAVAVRAPTRDEAVRMLFYHAEALMASGVVFDTMGAYVELFRRLKAQREWEARMNYEEGNYV
jgi:hypothetical protein